MRGIHMLCKSQAAATTKSLTMEEDPSSSSSSSSSSSTIHLGGSRAIDRHNPMIRGSRRLGTNITITPPNCSPYPPPTPKVSRENSSSSEPNNDQTAKSSSKSSYDHHHNKKKKSSSTDHKAGDHLISAPGDSSRYLLGEGTAFLDVLPHFDPVLALVPNSDPTKSQAVKPRKPFPPNPPPLLPMVKSMIRKKEQWHTKEFSPFILI